MIKWSQYDTFRRGGAVVVAATVLIASVLVIVPQAHTSGSAALCLNNSTTECVNKRSPGDNDNIGGVKLQIQSQTSTNYESMYARFNDSAQLTTVKKLIDVGNFRQIIDRAIAQLLTY